MPFPVESNNRAGALLSAKLNEEAAQFEFECNNSFILCEWPEQTGGKALGLKKSKCFTVFHC